MLIVFLTFLSRLLSEEAMLGALILAFSLSIIDVKRKFLQDNNFIEDKLSELKFVKRTMLAMTFLTILMGLIFVGSVKLHTFY